MYNRKSPLTDTSDNVCLLLLTLKYVFSMWKKTTIKNHLCRCLQSSRKQILRLLCLTRVSLSTPLSSPTDQCWYHELHSNGVKSLMLCVRDPQRQTWHFAALPNGTFVFGSDTTKDADLVKVEHSLIYIWPFSLLFLLLLLLPPVICYSSRVSNAPICLSVNCGLFHLSLKGAADKCLTIFSKHCFQIA